MAELVDALDLGSSASRRAGSSPVRRTAHAANATLLGNAGICAFCQSFRGVEAGDAALLRVLRAYLQAVAPVAAA